MHHALVGLRAFGEAVFWGTVGGGVYVVIAFALVGAGFDALGLVGLGAMIGLGVGVVTGLVGAVVAGALSFAKVDGGVCRVVAGFLSGACVAACCWLLISRETEGLWDTWLETPGDWLMFVVGPGVAAVAVGVWRGPAVLRAGTPRLAFNAARLDEKA